MTDFNNTTNVRAIDAKKLSDTAVIEATKIATKAFTDATQQAIVDAANAQAYSLTVSVPGGINLDTVTILFQSLGYTLEYLTNATFLKLDWLNPNVSNIILSTPNAVAHFAQ